MSLYIICLKFIFNPNILLTCKSTGTSHRVNKTAAVTKGLYSPGKRYNNNTPPPSPLCRPPSAYTYTYYVHHKFEFHENQQFLSTGMEFAKNWCIRWKRCVVINHTPVLSDSSIAYKKYSLSELDGVKFQCTQRGMFCHFICAGDEAH